MGSSDQHTGVVIGGVILETMNHRSQTVFSKIVYLESPVLNDILKQANLRHTSGSSGAKYFTY